MGCDGNGMICLAKVLATVLPAVEDGLCVKNPKAPSNMLVFAGIFMGIYLEIYRDVPSGKLSIAKT